MGGRGPDPQPLAGGQAVSAAASRADDESAGAPASRRRAAMLAGKVAPVAQTQRLSISDVERLRDDSSPEARISIAEKLGHQFDELAVGDSGALAQAILGLLVKDVEKDVRAALASAIASSPHVPRGVAARLARDEIEVAAPILERSPVLDDSQLAEIVRTHAMQYALAVAGRRSLSEALSAALVDTGHHHVVAKLAGNQGAQLSIETLRRIAVDHAHQPEVQDRLVRRPELPYELVEQLVAEIGQRLQWELVRTRQISPEEAARLISAVREQAAISITAREHNVRRAMAELKEQYLQGQLSPVDALRALKEGEISRFEGMVALLGEQELARVRRLLYGMDKRGTAAICIAAGFGAAHYIALRMALDLAEKGVARSTKAVAFSEEGLRFIQHQYDRMRSQPDLLAELIGRG